MKARYLRRTDVPPMPQDAPIDAIAQWLALQIEIRGHLPHWLAVLGVTKRFGEGLTYAVTVKDGGAGDPHRPFWHRPVFGYPRRELLHPEILRALKKLTGKNIVWGKDCREWWSAKAEPAGSTITNTTDQSPPSAARRG
jgi:hypothetical protein